MKEDQKAIEKVIKELLDRLGIEGDFSLELTEESINVILDTKDTGMVIGYHGETLEAIQLVLSLLISKKLGRFVRVSLEVGEYRKNRTDWLETLALSAKERVLQEGNEVTLPNLKSWERRIVHTFLQNDTDVTSESVGEGKERTLVIKKR